MAHDDHVIGCNHSESSGGGVCKCRSKKVNKQKKVPQRGLGVAQLEKIRLEEQQKKDSLNILTKNAIGSSANDSITPFLANFRPSNIESSVRISKRSSVDGGDLCSEVILSPRNGNWPKSWNGEYNNLGGGEDMRRNLIAFEPKLNLAYESNGPILPQRSHQFQRASTCSSLVKSSSSGISLVLNSQTEPPSNQSFQGNNYTNAPLWTEEDKMVGTKRSYPFSLESPPTSSLNRNFHPRYVVSTSKSDELAYGYSVHKEPRKKLIRESVSNSSLSDRNRDEVNSENQKLNGDFLTLAPPEVASPPFNSMHQHHGHELSEYERTTNQEYAKSQIHEAGPSGSVEHESFSFFPVKLNGEKEETIDLNLKL